MAICYSWKIPIEDVVLYDISYTPVGGVEITEALANLDSIDNGDGTTSFFKCLEEMPFFLQDGVAIVPPFIVDQGGPCETDGVCTLNIPLNELTVIPNDVLFGEAIDTRAFGLYEQGSPIPVVANAFAGYTFINWTVAGVVVSTNSNFTFIMPAEAVTLVANFVEDAQVEPDYGLRLKNSYENACGELTEIEVFQKDYTGPVDEVDASSTPITLIRENSDELFVRFRGMSATLSLLSRESLFYKFIFEGDERDFKVVYKRDALVKFTGWTIPDIYREPWKPDPYITSIQVSDGIGQLKEIPIVKQNGVNFTGQVTELEVIAAALRRTQLGLRFNIAINLKPSGVTGGLESILVNSEAFQSRKDGEILPLSCYDTLEKILVSYNACLFQEDGEWWIVRIPEMYSGNVPFRKYEVDGTFLASGTTPAVTGIQDQFLKLHAAQLEAMKAYKNVTVSQNYGDLIVEERNFVKNGYFNDIWVNFVNSSGGVFYATRDWRYYRLGLSPNNVANGLGRVRIVEEPISVDETNYYAGIFDIVRNFDGDIGYIESLPQPIKKEIGNLINITFRCKCDTIDEGVTRLVEAYYVIAVKCGTKWLFYNEGTKTYSWVNEFTRIRWLVPSLRNWETISIPDIEVPEDGDIFIRLHQMVQVGTAARSNDSSPYWVSWDDVQINLVKNAALLNRKVFYKGENLNTYTNSLDEVEIELGDALTVMSQNAKIVNGLFTSQWNRLGKTENLPLAKIIAKDYLNNFQATTFSLKSGRIKGLLSLLQPYTDVNSPGRVFLFTGGNFDDKKCFWNPTFIEINQTEANSVIRQTEEAGTQSGGSRGIGNAGGTGGSEAPPVGVPISLPDGVDNIIPVITAGRFEDSKIVAERSGDEVVSHRFINPVKGLPAENLDEFVTLSQLPNVTQYGRIAGGALQFVGPGLKHRVGAAIIALKGIWSVAGEDVNPDPADPTFDRFDAQMWEIDETDPDNPFVFVKYVKGDASANPIIPSPDPVKQVFGTAISIPAAATTIPGVTTEPIYLENTEWTVSLIGAGTVNADSTTNPKEGTKAVEVSNISSGSTLRFLRGTPISRLGFEVIGYDMALKANLNSGQNLFMCFIDGAGNAVSNYISIELNRNITIYQFLADNLSTFTFFSDNIQGFQILFTRSRGSNNYAGFFIDNVILQGGVTQPETPSLEVPPHNNLEGIQGGTESERYHLSKNLHDAAVAANGASAENPFATVNQLIEQLTADEVRDLLETLTADDRLDASAIKNLPSGGGGRDNDAVHYDADDEKSEVEKQRARSNIGSSEVIRTEITLTGTVDISQSQRITNHIVFKGTSATNLRGLGLGSEGELCLVKNEMDGINLALSAGGNPVNGGKTSGFNSLLPPNRFALFRCTGTNWIAYPLLSTDVGGTVNGVGNLNGSGVLDLKNENTNGSSVIFRLLRFDDSQLLNITSNQFRVFSESNNNILQGSGGIGVNPAWIIRNSIDATNRLLLSFQRGTTEIARMLSSGVLTHQRSNLSTASIIRDEQRLHYLILITTTGNLNDQTLTDGIFNYRFTNADEITGFGNGEIGRKITIQNDKAGNLILRHENTGSIAANRMNLIGSTDITIPTKGKVDLIYCTGNRWELSSKNF